MLIFKTIEYCYILSLSLTESKHSHYMQLFSTLVLPFKRRVRSLNLDIVVQQRPLKYLRFDSSIFQHAKCIRGLIEKKSCFFCC